MNIGEYLPRRSRGKYSPIFTEPEANNCFSIITEVNIRENQRIDCQTFLFSLFPEVVRQWTVTRADHMIFQSDFTDKKWQTCARTNILHPSENKTGENVPNKKLICFQFKQIDGRPFWKMAGNVRITSRQVIIAPDAVFLDQSEHRNLYIHLCNYTKNCYYIKEQKKSTKVHQVYYSNIPIYWLLKNLMKKILKHLRSQCLPKQTIHTQCGKLSKHFTFLLYQIWRYDSNEPSSDQVSGETGLWCQTCM